VTFRIFPSAQIMPINQELPAILSGQVSMTYSVAPVAASVEPLWGIFDLPFLFNVKLDDMSHVKAFFESEKGGGILASAMEKRGFKLISIAPTDYPSSFYLTRSEPIKTMDDLKGLKIRIAGGRIGQLAGEVYGYSPIAIAGAELVPALTQGVVDGGILPPIYAHDNKLPVKGLTIAPFGWPATTPIIMSLAEFNALTPDQQKVMMDTGKELAERALDIVEKNAAASIEALKEGGANVVFISDEDTPAWREKAQPVWDAFIEENGEDAKIMLEEVIALRPN
jgi:TRAP-type C4-dicarboxylate transport system substrate-binding protein